MRVFIEDYVGAKYLISDDIIPLWNALHVRYTYDACAFHNKDGDFVAESWQEIKSTADFDTLIHAIVVHREQEIIEFCKVLGYEVHTVKTYSYLSLWQFTVQVENESGFKPRNIESLTGLIL